MFYYYTTHHDYGHGFVVGIVGRIPLFCLKKKTNLILSLRMNHCRSNILKAFAYRNYCYNQMLHAQLTNYPRRDDSHARIKNLKF